ncbi:carboxypeptidase-like regulatory domain-containing protein [Alloacidobacterium sp.]|uniref:carboxypeptidase-like regulatory domain-containing protein n=1 Tax=Alloacidobacterium sp. TaxID=2951999 RepID=UPI002D391D78|nr:carboxypeptidase-like regulatory domain-containing protein [Alloacidobacterium sp.]HYK36775.1 carboxypeptidase-like regulatory domain-containing protein [Alloacidobacterium sp.]
MAHSRTVSVLCAALLIIPASLPQAQETSSPQTFDVRGTVLNSVTHEPIARVLVTLAGANSSSLLTDNEGRFDFANIPAGRSMLQARRPGFFALGSGRDLDLPIAVEPNVPDHVLQLEPAGVIEGHIILPSSDSGSNIRVQLMRRTIQEGRARWQPFGMKVTNSEGTFRFGNLQPGDYKLNTVASIDPDVASSQAPVRWGFPSASYPQEGGDNAAGFLKISPGQQLNAELSLTRVPFYSVTIPVANPQGYSMQISNENGRLNDVSMFYDSRQQQFRAWLPSGSYTVSIQTYPPTPGFMSQPITVRNTPVRMGSLAVLPIHPIPVTIHKEFASTNSPPQIIEIENGKQVEFSRDVNLMFFSVAGDESDGVNIRHEPGSDDSSWLLENALPGRYWVQAYANQGYVASITSGETDLARDSLVIGPGGAAAPIDIVLRNDMATLSVRVKNGSPQPMESTSPSENFLLQAPVQAPLGYLYLVPQFATSSGVQESIPLQQTVNIPNLQPGTYRVFALDHPVDLEYHNPKALQEYADRGQTVTLEPNGTASIDLDVTSAESTQP